MPAAGAAPRATLDLRLRVWGIGADNQPFHQNANAQCQPTGACICGLEHELKIGDVIGVQYEIRSPLQSNLGNGSGRIKKSSGWRAVGGRSGMSMGVPTAGQMRLTNLLFLPTIEESFAAQNFLPLEFRDERVNTPMRVNATDISARLLC